MKKHEQIFTIGTNKNEDVFSAYLWDWRCNCFTTVIPAFGYIYANKFGQDLLREEIYAQT